MTTADKIIQIKARQEQYKKDQARRATEKKVRMAKAAPGIPRKKPSPHEQTQQEIDNEQQGTTKTVATTQPPTTHNYIDRGTPGVSVQKPTLIKVDDDHSAGEVTGYHDTTTKQSIALTPQQARVAESKRHISRQQRVATATATKQQHEAPKKDTSNIQATRTDKNTSYDNVGDFVYPKHSAKNQPTDISSANLSRYQRMKQQIKKKLFTRDDTEPLTFQEGVSLVPVAVTETAKFSGQVVSGFAMAGVGMVRGLTVDLDKTFGAGINLVRGLSTQPVQTVSNIQTRMSSSFQQNPGFFIGQTTFVIAGPKIISKAYGSTKLKVNTILDKHSPSRPYYIKKLPAGYETHKGTFDQYILKYKGESFTRRGETVGVRRVQPLSVKHPSTWLDAVKGRKPGQIKYFDHVAEDIIIRDTPSEFATPATELSLGGTKQPIISATVDAKFLQGSGYTSISGGGKVLESLSGRAGVGGGELSQFFSSATTKPIAGVPAGTPQLYLFYTGLKKGSYKSSLPSKMVFFKPRPGAVFQKEFVVPVKNIKKPYPELAQELAGYTEPGTIQLSSSTLKGVRSELELLKAPQTYTVLSESSKINIPGVGSLKFFRGRNVPLSKAGTLKAYDANIGFLRGRITEVESLVVVNPRLSFVGQQIISRELINIKNIEFAKAKLLKKGSVLEVPPVVSQSSFSRSSSLSLEEIGFLKKFSSETSGSSPKVSYVTPADFPSVLPVPVSSSHSLSSSSLATSSSRLSSDVSSSNIPTKKFSSSHSLSSSSLATSSSRLSSGGGTYAPAPKIPFKKKRFDEEFEIFSRRKGVFFSIGKAKSLSEARRFGEGFTRSTLAASFKITRRGEEINLLPTNSFRSSKKEKGVIIQRREHRLGTTREINEIQRAIRSI